MATAMLYVVCVATAYLQAFGIESMASTVASARILGAIQRSAKR